mgnify:FL=1
MKTKDLSIYVHIPFCSGKCYYCNFCSSVENETTKKEYVECLINEINSSKFRNYVVKTIYFGGGTPSILNVEELQKILKTIRKKFVVDEDAEITIEGNPNSLSKEKLQKLKNFGFNRLSIGVQTFNKKSLEFVGRVEKENLKTYKQKVLQVLKQAREVGFENVSADFILGLPFQTCFQVERFLKCLSKYVDHFSCYMLQIEEGTKLFEILKNKNLDEQIAKQYEKAVKKLEKLGFLRYEISNFAKKGFESKHNSAYWERKDYLGFGLSAHSLIEKNRFFNTSNLKKYLSFWKTKNSFESSIEADVRNTEKLSHNDEKEETIMLSLRTRKGICLSQFEKDFCDIRKNKNYKFLLENKFLKEENGFVSLSSKGVLLANEIIVKLMD